MKETPKHILDLIRVWAASPLFNARRRVRFIYHETTVGASRV